MDESIIELERAAARGWQAADREWAGGWLLRASGGYTGRANSVLPLGAPDRSLPAAVDLVEGWYAGRGLRACFAIPHAFPAPAGDPLDDLLVTRGWGLRDGSAVVMTATTSEVAGLAIDVPVDISDRPDQEWLQRYHYRGGALPPAAIDLFVSAPFQRFAAVRGDDVVLAIGRLAIADGWGGYSAMEVAPDQRRRGLATAIVGALARVAGQRGVRNLYLQVEEDNDGARRFYETCGFQPHHRYHYRLAPGSV